MEQIQSLIELLKLEQQEQKKFYESHLKNVSLKERAHNGVSIYPINIQKKSFGIGSYPFIEAFHHQEKLQHFKTLSPIILECEQEDEIIKGQVQFVSKEKIGLILFQDDFPDWISDRKIGISATFDNSTFEIAFDVLNQINGTSQSESKEHIKSIQNIANYFYSNHTELNQDKNYTNSNLNESQENAVSQILNDDLVSIIHGPPGTGKTTTLSFAIKELAQQGKKILACAPSNAAVDHLSSTLIEQGLNVLRIGNPLKVSEKVSNASLDEKIKNHSQYKLCKSLQKQADELRKMSRQYKRKFGKEEREQRNALRKEVKKLQYEIKQIEKHIVTTIWEESDVITGTIYGAFKRWNHELFDFVILDESRQALPTDTWVAASMGKKLILAGDPFQLPPTIFSDEAIKKGLNISLIENWNERNQSNLLNVQYRMHPLIAQFSNQEFYGDQLQNGANLNEQVLDNSDFLPVEFIDTAGCGFDEEFSENKSLFNLGEIKILEELTQEYETKNIAIISPYRAQVNETTKAITSFSKNDIDTIDSFQGQEREVIIISLVRSNENQEIGFLKDYRRMNVALTRAKKKFIVIGDSSTIGNDGFYKRFLDFVEQNASYRSAWEYPNLF